MTSLNRNYLAATLVAAVGMTVHYVLPEDSPHKGEHRAAIVTNAFIDGPDGLVRPVNLTVFLDQANDLPEEQTFHPFSRAWGASYDPNGAPGTWHWPDIAVLSAAAMTSMGIPSHEEAIRGSGDAIADTRHFQHDRLRPRFDESNPVVAPLVAPTPGELPPMIPIEQASAPQPVAPWIPPGSIDTITVTASGAETGAIAVNPPSATIETTTVKSVVDGVQT